MDFFERQGDAKRRTALLVVTFLIALVLVIGAVDAVVWCGLRFFDQVPADPRLWLATPPAWWVTGTVAIIILGVSADRAFDLGRGGGGRVALSLGARMIDPDSAADDERVLLNVVEEMAIAAGMTVPDVYVLDRERSINAFAAGNRPADAAITVTRGLLDTLDREALQGVIAHEFSHILNGDMRMNIRLLALLAGMTAIGTIGAMPWRSLKLHRLERSRRGGIGHPFLLAAGLALIVIGWIGVFAGRLIKAGVSRQREYLADAAAVQFTRNPDGLGRALLAIHAADGDSRLDSGRAEQISHMAFGRTVGGIIGLTATHPTIEQRMTALGPKYVLWFNQGERARRRHRREGSAQTAAPATGSGPAAPLVKALGGSDAVDAALSTVALAALAGRTDGAAINHARHLLQRLPEPILHALRTPTGAADTVAALMLHGPALRTADQACLPETRQEQIIRLREALETHCPGETEGSLDAAIRLPVLELALRSLRSLASDERSDLLQRVDALIRSDGRVSVFEYAARSLLQHESRNRGARGGRNKRLPSQRGRIAIVISLLAHAGGGDDEARSRAYAHAMEPLFGRDAGTLLPLAECGLRAFSDALGELTALQPIALRSLLIACSDCVAADGMVHPAEAELLRTIAAVLDTPVPPIATSRG